MAQVAAEVGSTANRYQILAKLAVGGMAEIYLARGASVAGVERYCVLKRIRRERASEAHLVRMFLDEARLAVQLQHPNIASVYDVGVVGDSYFFTMEYVHGETIRSLLQRAHDLRRPVPLACVLTIIAGAAAGLHHAHERNANDGRPLGIVHRDVSPSNLMVSFEGNVKVVDFGLAKAAGRTVDTNSDTVKGKISYLSPEQCRGIRVDRRSDLFSVGIVMWEMLTGGRLYLRASDFDIMTAIVHEPLPPPSALRREIPSAIDSIVLRLLAKDVGERFQTAAEVVEAIEDASVRAGTILSTSAVSRLIRDLFGVRDEPWLELETDAPPHEAVTLLVPNSASVEPIDVVEAELVSLRDLTSSGMVEAGEISAWDLILTPHAGGPAVPATAPSPASATPAEPAPPPAPGRIAPVAQPPVPSARSYVPAGAQTPVTVLALPVDPDSSLDATILTEPLPDAVAASPSEQIAVPESQRSAAAAGNFTLLGVGAPPPSGTKDASTTLPPPKPLSAHPPHVPVASPAPFIAKARRPLPERIGSALRPMPVRASVAPSSMATRPARGPRAWVSRMSRPQLAAAVLAVVIGVVMVKLATGGPSGSSAPAADPAAAPGLPDDPALRHAIRAGRGGDSLLGGAGASDSPPDAPINAPIDAPLHADDTQRSDPPGIDQPDAAAVATSGPVRDAGSSAPPRVASPATPTRSPPALHAEASPRPRPPADAGPAHRPPLEKSPAPASAPANRPAPLPAPLAQLPLPSPPAGESMPVWLSKLYHQADYAAIMQVCSGTKVTADIASVCVLAACQGHAAAKAKTWLSKVAKPSRDTTAARCKDLGNIDLQSN